MPVPVSVIVVPGLCVIFCCRLKTTDLVELPRFNVGPSCVKSPATIIVSEQFRLNVTPAPMSRASLMFTFVVPAAV